MIGIIQHIDIHFTSTNIIYNNGEFIVHDFLYKTVIINFIIKMFFKKKLKIKVT